jgi:hypothetical protein
LHFFLHDFVRHMALTRRQITEKGTKKCNPGAS